MKKLLIILLTLMFIFSLVACGGGPNNELVGRWVSEESSDWVTTFNEDGTGTHAISWGYGTTFNWSTRRDNIVWSYQDHPEVETTYSISDGVLYIIFYDGTTFRYIRD